MSSLKAYRSETLGADGRKGKRLSALNQTSGVGNSLEQASSLLPAPDAFHAPRGTCVPDCPRYGWCHCLPECNARTTIADQNRRASTRYGEWVKGRPLVHAWGHSNAGGAWIARGFPAGRLQGPLERLYEAYGTWGRVAEAAGISWATLNNLRFRQLKNASPPTARAIIVAVLRIHRPLDPLTTFELEEPARLAMKRDQALAERTRRANLAAQRRAYRGSAA